MLLNSGMTSLFIDNDVAVNEKLTMHSLLHPAPVYNMDGMPIEGGAIWNIVNVILRFQDHSEHAIFAVTNLGKRKMILGYPWLHEYNPEVNWKTQEVTLSQYPAQCYTCRANL